MIFLESEQYLDPIIESHQVRAKMAKEKKFSVTVKGHATLSKTNALHLIAMT